MARCSKQPHVASFWTQTRLRPDVVRLGPGRHLRGHDDFVTIAEIRTPESYPNLREAVDRVRQPIVLDHWRRFAEGGNITSIGFWRGPYAPLVPRRTYGFELTNSESLHLPRLTDAASSSPSTSTPLMSGLTLLRENGCPLIDPRTSDVTQPPIGLPRQSWQNS